MSLLRAHAGLAAGFLLAGFSPNLGVFTLALIVQGTFGGAMAASNAYLATQLAGESLSRALNLTQYSARLALLSGPVLVGLLASAGLGLEMYRYLAWLPLVAFLLANGSRLALVAHCAAQLGVDPAEAALRWLRAYAGLLLDGSLHCLFRHGVVLEPHLQNTLLGFDDQGLPCRVWIRDLEGTKLVPEHWPAKRLAHLDERTRASLHYDADKAWKRVAYCALVNNLGEAVFHLANGDAALERRLWREIAAILEAQRAPLPSKENFMTRLLMRADREAGYTALPNPLTAARGDCR